MASESRRVSPRKTTLIVAALLLLLVLLFLGRTLVPADGQALGAHDMRGLFYPWFSFVKSELAQGRAPFWDPYQFNGYPFLHNPQVGFFYPPAWLAILLPVRVGISLYVALHLWLAALGMFLFVRRTSGGTDGALLAALAFAFGGFVGARLWAGHIGLLATVTWLPWLLLALSWSVERATWRAAVVAGAPLGLAALAGHIPIFFYVLIVWGAFVLFLLLTAERRSLVARQALIMLSVGLGLAAVQLVPLVQLSLFSQRAAADFAFASAYSLPPAHFVTLLVPGFFGDPVTTGYWSVPVFEELTYYAGILVVVGLVLGLARPTRLTWFYVVLIVLGLWLALGRYGALYGVAFDLLPPFRVMRAPARAALLYVFAGSALLGHALAVWRRAAAAERQPAVGRILRWALVVGGLAGFAALAATGAVFITIHPTDTSGRLWHQVGGYATAVVVLLLGGLLLYGLLTTGPARRNRGRFLIAALVLVAVADLWQFSRPLVRTEAMAPEAVWPAARDIIGATPDRVLPWGLSIFAQTGATQVGLHSVFGYQALEPANLVALASSVADPRSSAYDVLGVQYVIAPNPLEGYGDGDAALEEVARGNGAAVYRRPTALPVARLVYEAEVIADTGAVINRIHDPTFAAERVAVVETDPPCAVGPPPPVPGTAQVEASAPGAWRIRTGSDAPALLLLAESAFPGWQATVDGQPAELITAYATIRAVCVPAGEHIVEQHFRPTIFLAGGAISALSLVLLAVAAIGLRRSAAAAPATVAAQDGQADDDAP